MILALCLFAALATPAAEARESYALGRALYDDGRFDEALHAFERAHAQEPLPGFLFNIAQCHMQAQRYERAIGFYERFLEEDPRTEHRTLVLSLIDEAHALRRKSQRVVAVAEQSNGLPFVEEEDRSWIFIGVAAGALAAIAGSAVLYQLSHRY